MSQYQVEQIKVKWRNKDKCAQQVEDSRIARLVDGRILIGRDLGITTIQVCALFLFP